jgi:lysophospholipase L1-like esterase
MNHITYTAIGDSLTEGIGAYFSTGFVRRYAYMTEITLNTPVKTNIFSKNRLTSTELLETLKKEYVRRGIEQANIITISIGGNDLLQAYRAYSKSNDIRFIQNALHLMYGNFRKIIAEINTIKSNSPVIPYFIRIIGLYNPYPHLPYSDYWIQQFNHTLDSFTSSGIQFVNIYPIFHLHGKKLLSFGGIHPNGNGYQLIAEQVAKSGYFPLTNI